MTGQLHITVFFWGGGGASIKGCINLITSDSEDIYNVTRYFSIIFIEESLFKILSSTTIFNVDNCKKYFLSIKSAYKNYFCRNHLTQKSQDFTRLLTIKICHHSNIYI